MTIAEFRRCAIPGMAPCTLRSLHPIAQEETDERRAFAARERLEKAVTLVTIRVGTAVTITAPGTGQSIAQHSVQSSGFDKAI